MTEPPIVAHRAAADQGVEKAKDEARVCSAFYRQLRDDDVPADLARDLTVSWWDSVLGLNDDEDDEGEDEE